MRTYVRMMGLGPHRPIRELEGAIERRELDMAIGIAKDIARERRPIGLELALRARRARRRPRAPTTTLGLPLAGALARRDAGRDDRPGRRGGSDARRPAGRAAGRRGDPSRCALSEPNAREHRDRPARQATRRPWLGREALGRARPPLGRLDLAILRRSRVTSPSSRRSVASAISSTARSKTSAFACEGLRRAADLAHVLKRRLVDLALARGGLEVVEGSDVSAHAHRVEARWPRARDRRALSAIGVSRRVGPISPGGCWPSPVRACRRPAARAAPSGSARRRRARRSSAIRSGGIRCRPCLRRRAGPETSGVLRDERPGARQHIAPVHPDRAARARPDCARSARAPYLLRARPAPARPERGYWRRATTRAGEQPVERFDRRPEPSARVEQRGRAPPDSPRVIGGHPKTISAASAAASRRRYQRRAGGAPHRLSRSAVGQQRNVVGDVRRFEATPSKEVVVCQTRRSRRSGPNARRGPGSWHPVRTRRPTPSTRARVRGWNYDEVLHPSGHLVLGEKLRDGLHRVAPGFGPRQR